MPLINRFTRLFTADLHAVLDRIEEPGVLLRQAVREMEEELAHMQTRQRTLGEQLQRAAEHGDRERATLGRLDEELDICFAADEQELARSLVKRKLEATRRLEQAHSTRDAASKALVELERTLTANADRLNDMREKLGVLVDPAEAPLAGETTARHADPIIASEEIDVAFLREKQRRVRP